MHPRSGKPPEAAKLDHGTNVAFSESYDYSTEDGTLSSLTVSTDIPDRLAAMATIGTVYSYNDLHQLNRKTFNYWGGEQFYRAFAYQTIDGNRSSDQIEYMNYRMPDGSLILGYQYGYDANGRIATATPAAASGGVDTTRAVTYYSYDTMDQLVGCVDKRSGSTVNYTYTYESGFYYLQSRYYDPAIGRFISSDTFATTDASGFLSYNMFAYCENDPIAKEDPTGHIVNVIIGAFVGGVAGWLGAKINGTDPMIGLTTGALNGALCGALPVAPVSILYAGAIGIGSDFANQSLNKAKKGEPLRNYDYGSMAISGFFSALSAGMQIGVDYLVNPQIYPKGNAIVTTVRNASNALLGVGASKIYSQAKHSSGSSASGKTYGFRSRMVMQVA